jgi:hypothetical protein
MTPLVRPGDLDVPLPLLRVGEVYSFNKGNNPPVHIKIAGAEVVTPLSRGQKTTIPEAVLKALHKAVTWYPSRPSPAAS